MKRTITKFCVIILSTFISIVVPFALFVVPCVSVILYEDPLFLLFYIVTLPLSFLWYSFVPKAWKEIKNDVIETLVGKQEGE